MARYSVSFRQSVLKKDFDLIPKSDLRRIIESIRSLADNPRPHGMKKLTNQEQYRIRQGDYRIMYSIQDDDALVHITKVAHRREIYR